MNTVAVILLVAALVMTSTISSITAAADKEAMKEYRAYLQEMYHEQNPGGKEKGKGNPPRAWRRKRQTGEKRRI